MMLGRAAGLVALGLVGGCAFGNGIGTGVARSTEPVAGHDVSASMTSYYLDGYLTLGPFETITGMALGSARSRSRSADLTGAGADNHSSTHSLFYLGVGLPTATDRGLRLMPYVLYGVGALGNDEILPADIKSQFEVGAEIGIFRLWGIKNLARHGFALRVAFLQIQGNLVDSETLSKVDTYTGRGMTFVLSWRTTRWRWF